MNHRDFEENDIHRKNSYKPIMLTSKAMKPVNRQTEKRKYQKKLFSKTKYIFPEPQLAKTKSNYFEYTNSFDKNEIIHKLTEQYKQSLLKQLEQDEQETQTYGEEYKIVSHPSVITMEFLSHDSSESQPRYDHNFQSNQRNVADSKMFRKFLKFASIKTYDNFMKLDKIRLNASSGLGSPLIQIKKQDSLPQSSQKNCRTHYLSIKKVSPEKLEKKKKNISQQKMNQISQKVQEYQNSLIKKFDHRYRASSVMIKRKSEKQKDSQQAGSQKVPNFFEKGDSRIEEDMLMKRSQGKKDHFVFGLSGSPSKGGGEVKGKFEAFKDFLWKVNFSNGLYVRIPDQLDSPYKVFVGRGNNSLLVKGIIRRRPWWQLVDKITDDTNFVWTQLKVNDFFALQKKHDRRKMKLRMAHSSIESKNHEKVKQQSEKQKLPLIPNEEDLTSKLFKGEDYQLWSRHYHLHKQAEDKLEGQLKKRIKTMIRKKKLQFITQVTTKKLQNHMPCNYFLGNKKALFYLLRKYYQLQEKDPFNFLPLTFHIVKGVDDPEYKKFLEVYFELEQKKRKRETQNLWIMKPGELTNRGRGITVCSSLDDIKLRLRGREKSRTGKLHTFILQKYIERPLLYNKRKFDIRHFMVMSCVGGRMKGYWHGEGYLRTSSSEYSGRNPKDLLTHLTNDAVQQAHPDYGRFERANKLSYADFHKYLLHTTRGRCHFHHLLPTMQAIGRDCMRAAYARLAPRRQDCFELFGLDFMVDEELRVRLIEANTNPCLDTSCPLLSRVVAGLLENLLKLCVDPIFPPPHDWPAQRKFQLGDSLADNRFTLIFDEACPTDTLPVIDLDHKMGDIEEEDQEFDDEGNEFVED